MQMEYSAKHFKKMSIRTSTGETTIIKLKEKYVKQVTILQEDIIVDIKKKFKKYFR